MSNLTPTAPVAGSSTSASSGGSGGDQNFQSTPARVVNLPSPLQNLQQNVMLGARLVGANPDGSVVLRTAQGDLTLNVPIPVPAGATLQVQLQPGNPPAVTLLLLGGAAESSGSQSAQQTSAQLPTLNVPSLATTPPAQLPDLKLNNVVRALVMEIVETLVNQLDPEAIISGNLSTGNLTQANTAALSALVNKPEVLANMLEQLAAKAGSATGNAQAQLLSQLGAPGKLPSQIGQLSIPARLLETVQQTILLLQQQPGGTKGLSNDQNALLQLLQFGQNAAATSGTRVPQITSQLLPGMELNLKLVQIIPPAPGTNTPVPVTVLPNASGVLTISGQIAPQLVNGQPVLQTEQGTILLQSNKLPVGTTLVFEVVPNATKAAPTILPQLNIDPSRLNTAMPKLEQAMLMLNQIDGDMMRLVMNSMPRMNGQFPSTVLFFMHALQTGEVRNWLGDKTLQTLRRSGSEGAKLIEELSKEFSKAAVRSQNVPSGEWRQFNIPYMGEQGLSQMRFAVRDHYQSVPDDPKKGKGGRGGGIESSSRVTRFLFDIEFSELGPMQIDGLMRPGTDDKKQLDIVLRTRELLPADMRRELREIFTESLGAYDMAGGLSYQAGYQNWIRLAEERSNSAKI